MSDANHCWHFTSDHHRCSYSSGLFFKWEPIHLDVTLLVWMNSFFRTRNKCKMNGNLLGKIRTHKSKVNKVWIPHRFIFISTHGPLETLCAKFHARIKNKKKRRSKTGKSGLIVTAVVTYPGGELWVLGRRLEGGAEDLQRCSCMLTDDQQVKQLGGLWGEIHQHHGQLRVNNQHLQRHVVSN